VAGIDIRVMGDTVTVSGMVVSMTTATAVAREQAVGPVKNAAALFDQVARRLVNSLGADAPRCGKWTGQIALKSSRDQTGKKANDPKSSFTDRVSLKISCAYQEGTDPTCEVSYSASLSGSGASTTSSAGGSARCAASASVAKGRAFIRLGPCEAEGTYGASVEGTTMEEKKRFSFGSWSHEYDISPTARTLSGSKPLDDKETTLSWSLSK
jgi:hypothetical protein